MWQVHPAFSGIRDNRATAAGMPACGRGAPFGVPVVPEVRMIVRGLRVGGDSSSDELAERISSSMVSGLAGIGQLSVQPITRCSMSTSSSSPSNSSS